MSTVIDMTGQTFGQLTVLAADGYRHNRLAWLCQCSCGNTTTVAGGALRSGNTKSCGCRRLIVSKKLHTRHGHTANLNKTKTYLSWRSMWWRCRQTKPEVAKYYKDKGITVCDRWKSFTAFLEDMGEAPPGFTLDRIDGSKNYELGNCRWATRKTQRENQPNIGWRGIHPRKRKEITNV